MTDPHLPNLSGLVALAREGAIDIRPVLLRVQTDLFLSVPTHAPQAIASFQALATGLIPVVDEPTLGVVAHKLAPHPDTPPAVLEALRRAGGAAEEAVLALAPALDEELLLATARAGAPHLAAAVARRPHIAAPLADTLLARQSDLINAALAGNAAARLPADVLDRLVERARRAPDLAALVIARRDVGAMAKAALFPHAGGDERDLILSDIERHLALQGRRRAGPRLEAEARDRLVAAAARSDDTAFAAVLASILAADMGDVQRLVAEESGEMLALALIAAGVEEDDALRIFLTLTPALARSVERVFALIGRVRAVPREVALRVVDAVLGRPSEVTARGPQGSGTHVPVMAASGTPARGVPRPAALPQLVADRDRDRSTG